MSELYDKLVCPISKQKLKMEENGELSSPCGFSYRNFDFRVGLEFSEKWEKGQIKYEKYETSWIANLNSEEMLQRIDAETADIYEQLNLDGNLLDVGGSYGSIIVQANLDGSQYYSVDPNYINWNDIRNYDTFYNHYKACENAHRVMGFAEFLPFSDGAFDVVHMRSCIDHFSNPSLALKEAFRVLRAGGKLIVGVSLIGAYRRDASYVKRVIKGWTEKSGLVNDIMEFVTADPHMFHPTETYLLSLINSNGFNVNRMLRQAAYHNVVYVEAIRATAFPINQ